MPSLEEIKAKRKLHQEMMAKALMQSPTVNPGEPIAKAFQPALMMLGGMFQDKRLAGQEKDAQEKYRTTLANALSPGKDIGAASTELMQNPDTADAGLQLRLAEMKNTKPAEWKLGEIGAGGDQRRSIFYNPLDPASFKPVGQPYRKTEGVSISMGSENDPNAPWRHIGDPKKRDEAKTRFGIEADKMLAKEQEDVVKAQGTNQALDRFLSLNKTTTTGAGYDLPVVGGIAQTVASFDPEFKEMQSLQDRLTPAMRQGMPGAASDRDVAMFKSATVGVGKPSETNKNVALGLKAANENQIQRYQFMNEYVTQRGHLRGAEQEWKKYLQANPIFDPSKPDGSYVINPNRKSYEEWKMAGDTKTNVPRAGTVEDGHIFMGGDPADPKNWKKQK